MENTTVDDKAPQPRGSYEQINHGWPKSIPPITRIEAERAAKRLARHFGFRTFRVRRCWIAVSPPYHTLDRGWRRLVHDLSHDWFEQVYPNKRLHDNLHSRYESEMAAFVLTSGWLDGKLRPKPKTKPGPQERKSEKLARTLAAIKRWEQKEKRAKTALKKLERRRKYYESRAAV